MQRGGRSTRGGNVDAGDGRHGAPTSIAPRSQALSKRGPRGGSRRGFHRGWANRRDRQRGRTFAGAVCGASGAASSSAGLAGVDADDGPGGAHIALMWEGVVARRGGLTTGEFLDLPWGSSEADLALDLPGGITLCEIAHPRTKRPGGPPGHRRRHEDHPTVHPLRGSPFTRGTRIAISPPGSPDPRMTASLRTSVLAGTASRTRCGPRTRLNESSGSRSS